MPKHVDQTVELGDLVRDHITGFQGIVTCIADWLYGCRRAVVQPRELNVAKEYGKKVPEGESFDITSLEVIEKNAVPAPGKKTTARTNAETTGGPMPNEHVALRRP